MKKNHFICLTLLFVLITSCSKEDDTKIAIKPVKVNVRSQISEMTRAVNQQWEDGDKIGINANSDEESFDNVPYIYHNTFNGTDDQNVYFKYEDQEMNLSAYYPYTPSNQIHNGVIDIKTYKDFGEAKFSVNRNYMFARSVTANSNNPDANFRFEHKMVKVIINVHPSSGITIDQLYAALKQNFMFISGVKHDGTFNVRTGDLRLKPNARNQDDIIIDSTLKNENGVVSFVLYLIPQRIEYLDISVKLSGNRLCSTRLRIPFNEKGVQELAGGHAYECKIVADPTQNMIRESYLQMTYYVRPFSVNTGTVSRHL